MNRQKGCQESIHELQLFDAEEEKCTAWRIIQGTHAESRVECEELDSEHEKSSSSLAAYKTSWCF